MTTATATAVDTSHNALTTGRLPRWAPWALLAFSWLVFVIVFSIIAMAGATEFNIAAALFLGTILFDVLIFAVTYLVEGVRQARDRLMTSLVATAFIIALLPLVSLLFTVLVEIGRAHV